MKLSFVLCHFLWQLIKHHHFFYRVVNKLTKERSKGWCFCPPQHIWIEPTTKCNLSCHTCPLKFGNLPSRDIHPVIYKAVIKQLIPYVRSVDTIGLGEPFLAKCISEMIKTIVNHGIRISVTTNLTVWKPELLEIIIKASGEICVSIDGITAETHEAIREGSNFSKLQERLILLAQKAKEIANPKFQLRLNFVVMRKNISELEGIVRFAAKYDIKYIMVLNFGIRGRTDEFAHESLVYHQELVHQYFPKVQSIASELGVNLTLPTFAVENNLHNDNGNSTHDENQDFTPENDNNSLRNSQNLDTNHQQCQGIIPWPQKCLSPWIDSYIDIDGGVRACCLRGEVLGNLQEQLFVEIWNGSKYRELRTRVNSNDPPEYCKYCNLPWGITGGDENWYTNWMRCQKPNG